MPGAGRCACAVDEQGQGLELVDARGVPLLGGHLDALQQRSRSPRFVDITEAPPVHLRGDTAGAAGAHEPLHGVDVGGVAEAAHEEQVIARLERGRLLPASALEDVERHPPDGPVGRPKCGRRHIEMAISSFAFVTPLPRRPRIQAIVSIIRLIRYSIETRERVFCNLLTN